MPNGDTYTGGVHKDKPHGYGILKTADGSLYHGIHVNGLREGFGMLESSDTSKYVGYWLNDKEHGKGYLEDKDGNKVSCEFKNGVRI